jgi:hypothetical protein
VTYIPPDIIDETKFPLAQGKDLDYQNQLAAEKYMRFFAPQSYFMLLKDVTPVVRTAEAPTTLSGVAGTTAYDPLYGESVPATVSGKWQQPHGNPAETPAADVEKWADAVLLNFRIRRDNRDNQLQKWGVERGRLATAVIPTILLDNAGVTCRAGDRLTWNGERFSVVYVDTGEYWKNTNIPIFLELTCITERRGA